IIGLAGPTDPKTARDFKGFSMPVSHFARADSDLTAAERDLLALLAREDFSQYGECHGPALDALIAKGLAQVHGPSEHQVFIAKGPGLMYRAPSGGVGRYPRRGYGGVPAWERALDRRAPGREPASVRFRRKKQTRNAQPEHFS